MKKTLKKGFTLVELVIVIAVIAILSAVLIPTFGNVISNAKKSAAQSEASNAISQYVTNQASAGADTNIADGYVIVLKSRYDVISASDVDDGWKDEIDYVFVCTNGAVDTNTTVNYNSISSDVYDLEYADSAATVGTGETATGTIYLDGTTLTYSGVYLLDYKIDSGKVSAKVILLAKK
ncbi:MAG: type II secretion system protein [Clostridia bacterium]|nr:type II secretion system protein [Clostridia bacterium]